MNGKNKPERVRQIDIFGIDNPYLQEQQEHVAKINKLKEEAKERHDKNSLLSADSETAR